MSQNLVEVSKLMETAITKSRLLKEGMLKSQWSTVVGGLSKKSHVIFMKQGKVFIGVENSIWIQQMSFQKQSIIKKINDFLGDNYINELVFKIGKQKTEDYFLDENKEYNDSKESSIKLDEMTLTEEEYLKIEEEVEEIKSEAIKKHTKIILEKSYKRKKYLKLHGYKICKCGVQYNSPTPMCTVCMNKEVLELEATLMKSFKNHELLRYSQAKEVIPELKEKEYDRIKLKKLSRLKKDIDIYLRNKKDHLAFELAKRYMYIDLANLDEEYISRRATEFLQVLKKQ